MLYAWRRKGGGMEVGSLTWLATVNCCIEPLNWSILYVKF